MDENQFLLIYFFEIHKKKSKIKSKWLIDWLIDWLNKKYLAKFIWDNIFLPNPLAHLVPKVKIFQFFFFLAIFLSSIFFFWHCPILFVCNRFFFHNSDNLFWISSFPVNLRWESILSVNFVFLLIDWFISLPFIQKTLCSHKSIPTKSQISFFFFISFKASISLPKCLFFFENIYLNHWFKNDTNRIKSTFNLLPFWLLEFAAPFFDKISKRKKKKKNINHLKIIYSKPLQWGRKSYKKVVI